MKSTGRRNIPKKTIIRNSVAENILKKIRSSEKESLPVEMVPLLSKWIKIQLKHGLSLEEIAKELNNLEVPTLSGLGAWKSDTIEYLLDKLI